MSNTTGAQRLAAFIANARRELGYSNREHLANKAGISPRVLADLESATRENFSARVIGRLEDALGWPAGTAEAIRTDPSVTPPAASPHPYQAPVYSRDPLPIDITAIETLLGALHNQHAAGSGATATPVDAAALEVGRAAVTAVLEDNFRPDLGLHPGVRHQFDDFTELAARLGIPRDGYMQWLTGDARAIDEDTEQSYLKRWTSRHRRRAAA